LNFELVFLRRNLLQSMEASIFQICCRPFFFSPILAKVNPSFSHLLSSNIHFPISLINFISTFFHLHLRNSSLVTVLIAPYLTDCFCVAVVWLFSSVFTATTTDCFSNTLSFSSVSGRSHFFYMYSSWNATFDCHWGNFLLYMWFANSLGIEWRFD
jgi:hypothetical protein